MDPSEIVVRTSPKSSPTSATTASKPASTLFTAEQVMEVSERVNEEGREIIADSVCMNVLKD